MVKKSLRPWQGTVLAVFGIIGIVFAFLGGLALIFLQSLIVGMLSSIPSTTIDITLNGNVIPPEVAMGGFVGILASLGIAAGLIVIALGVFEIFVVRGLLNGKKWAVIVSLVCAVLGVLQSLTITENSSMITAVAINGFALYCAIMCLKSPFYKKN